MSRIRLPLFLAAVAAALLVSWSLAHAASRLLHFDLQWRPGGAVSLHVPNGRSLLSLKPGQQVSVRQGSETLTMALSLPARAKSSRASLPASSVVTHLLAAINQDRAAHNAAPLALNSQQSPCSLKHSEHMARVGYISHDQFPLDVCVTTGSAGENVGFASGSSSNASLKLERMMMAEGPCPDTHCTAAELHKHGHYLNLINPAYKSVGIGIISQNGYTWLTEDFIG